MKIWPTTLALLLAAAPAGATDAFALHDGDRVVFYGDSITEQKFYTTIVEDYVATRFPGRAIDFVNAGWASDSVAGGFGGPIETRLARDVFAWKPTVVTVMLGMNDGKVKPWSDETAAAYEAGYKGILDALAARAPKARVTLLTPSPYDDVTRPADFPGGYNGVLLRFGDFVRGQAAARGHGVVDMNAPVVKLLGDARAIDPDLAKMLISDRVHPSQGAQWLMAAALLEGWHATPWVSRVELDAGRAPQVRDARQASVSGLTTQGAGLAWQQRDQALPMPVERTDARVKLALRASDVEARLNRQTLVVHGLAAGSWALKIDGQAVGRFPAAALDAGVELAGLETPMAKQALDIHALTLAHQTVRFSRWRGMEVAAAAWPSAERDRALAAGLALDADLLRRRRALAQPRPHRFELTPEGSAVRGPGMTTAS